DLLETPFGRQVHRALLAAARRHIDRTTPADDEATRRMHEAVLAEAPLRAVTLLGGGRPPLAVTDRVIDALNGRPREALTELVERLRS
ncbi:MAG: hypothetical protein ACOCT8_05545, partial [Actinomycetota bacterium]